MKVFFITESMITFLFRCIWDLCYSEWNNQNLDKHAVVEDESGDFVYVRIDHPALLYLHGVKHIDLNTVRDSALFEGGFVKVDKKKFYDACKIVSDVLS